MNAHTTRRTFLSTGVAALATSRLGATRAPAGPSGRDGASFGVIGAGIRGKQLMREAAYFSSCAALCDVDAAMAADAGRVLEKKYRDKQLAAPRPETCEDYRRVLDRKDIGVVLVATPDHWHSKIAIEALHAGKAVYCEKPLTLTIAEGRRIEQAIRETGGLLAVGAQQRSSGLFQTACALVRAGRIGKVRRVTCALGGSPESGPLPTTAPPSGMNWNRWLGPAPYVPYRQASQRPASGYGSQFPHGRGHAHFRWWYEYSGGKMTDWGAHHVDIAMWALDRSTGDIGPLKVEPLVSDHAVEFSGGMPVQTDRFNTANRFHVRVTLADGVELDLRHTAKEDLGFDNGVMFEGEKGRFLVNRSKLVGKPVEELKENPLGEEAYRVLHPTANPKGRWHMQNFFDAVAGKTTPITDAASHHRHLAVCHAANLALRLGRGLTFDPAEQRFAGDEEANALLSRAPRKGFETNA